MSFVTTPSAGTAGGNNPHPNTIPDGQPTTDKVACSIWSELPSSVRTVAISELEDDVSVHRRASPARIARLSQGIEAGEDYFAKMAPTPTAISFEGRLIPVTDTSYVRAQESRGFTHIVMRVVEATPEIGHKLAELSNLHRVTDPSESAFLAKKLRAAGMSPEKIQAVLGVKRAQYFQLVGLAGAAPELHDVIYERGTFTSTHAIRLLGLAKKHSDVVVLDWARKVNDEELSVSQMTKAIEQAFPVPQPGDAASNGGEPQVSANVQATHVVIETSDPAEKIEFRGVSYTIAEFAAAHSQEVFSMFGWLYAARTVELENAAARVDTLEGGEDDDLEEGVDQDEDDEGVELEVA